MQQLLKGKSCFIFLFSKFYVHFLCQRMTSDKSSLSSSENCFQDVLHIHTIKKESLRISLKQSLLVCCAAKFNPLINDTTEPFCHLLPPVSQRTSARSSAHLHTEGVLNKSVVRTAGTGSQIWKPSDKGVRKIWQTDDRVFSGYVH